jgi:hypothetical protein
MIKIKTVMERAVEIIRESEQKITYLSIEIGKCRKDIKAMKRCLNEIKKNKRGIQ